MRPNPFKAFPPIPKHLQFSGVHYPPTPPYKPDDMSDDEYHEIVLLDAASMVASEILKDTGD